MMSLFCYLKENWGDTHTTTLVTTHSPSAPFAEALEVLNLGEENGQRTHMFTHDAETRHHEDATPPEDTNTVRTLSLIPPQRVQRAGPKRA